MRRAEIPAAFAAALKLHQSGDLAGAESLYRQIIEAQRTHVEAVHFLGMALHQAGRVDEAMPLLQKSLSLQPANPVFHDNMVVVYQALRQPHKALEHARAAARLNPSGALAQYNLGVTLAEVGELSGAVDAYRRAMSLRQGYVQAMNNLSTALLKLDRAADAAVAARSAVETSPQLPEPQFNLACAQKRLNQPDEAIASLKRAIQRRPNYASAWNVLGSIHQDRGELDDALHAYTTAEQSRPDFAAAGSNRLMVMNFQDELDNPSLFAAHRAWGARYAPPPATKRSFANARAPDCRLRVGYVSADFRMHSVGTFLEPLLAAHDPAAVEVTCYAHVYQPDAATARFEAMAHRWRRIERLNDAQLESQIRDDEIDILIDLAGHTGEHRLQLFGRQPAPVQVSYLGWQNTTGVESIGYRLTDVYTDPPGHGDAYYTEKLLRLPETFAVYSPPDEATGDLSPLPAISKGRVTFGSFARLDKITPATLRLWADVMRRVERSRLIMVASGLHSPTVRQRILSALCGDGGISADRIELIGAVSFTQYLQLHDRVDLILDTFPFNGHTTTCHGLWMGVPPITLAGDRFASRMGLSVLTNLGLGEFAATHAGEFADRAAAACADLQSLAAVRAGMRDRMRSSPLMNAMTFARHVEAVLRSIWREWCDHGE